MIRKTAQKTWLKATEEMPAGRPVRRSCRNGAVNCIKRPGQAASGNKKGGRIFARYATSSDRNSDRFSVRISLINSACW